MVVGSNLPNRLMLPFPRLTVCLDHSHLPKSVSRLPGAFNFHQDGRRSQADLRLARQTWLHGFARAFDDAPDFCTILARLDRVWTSKKVPPQVVASYCSGNIMS